MRLIPSNRRVTEIVSVGRDAPDAVVGDGHAGLVGRGRDDPVRAVVDQVVDGELDVGAGCGCQLVADSRRECCEGVSQENPLAYRVPFN